MKDFDLPFFKLWVADFLVDTVHWTDEEIGAYFRLLLHQWKHGSVPTERKRRDRICDSLGDTWDIIKEKFPVSADGRLQNRRLEREREEVVMTLMARRRGGIKSAIKQGRKITSEQAELVTQLPPELVTELPLELPPQLVTVQSSEFRDQKKKSSKREIDQVRADFDQWWSVYPKRVGKKKCLERWLKMTRPSVEEMIEKLQDQIARDRSFREGYIRNPLTYLNGEHWDDDIDTRPTEAEREDEKQHRDNMRALGI